MEITSHRFDIGRSDRSDTNVDVTERTSTLVVGCVEVAALAGADPVFLELGTEEKNRPFLVVDVALCFDMRARFRGGAVGMLVTWLLLSLEGSSIT